jgi:hypothetical protein
MSGKLTSEPLMGSFEEAEFFRLRQGLALTPMQRLQDLEDMLQFNDEAEQRNPGLRWAAARLRD